MLSATLIVSAVALIGLSWDDIWRVCGAIYGGCVERSAGAVWGAGFGWLIVDTMA